MSVVILVLFGLAVYFFIRIRRRGRETTNAWLRIYQNPRGRITFRASAKLDPLPDWDGQTAQLIFNVKKPKKSRLAGPENLGGWRLAPHESYPGYYCLSDPLSNRQVFSLRSLGDEAKGPSEALVWLFDALKSGSFYLAYAKSQSALLLERTRLNLNEAKLDLERVNSKLALAVAEMKITRLQAIINALSSALRRTRLDKFQN